MRRSALEEFVRRGERSETFLGRLRSFVEFPDNLLAVVQNADLMARLDVDLLRVAEARGGTFVKCLSADARLPTIGEIRGLARRSGVEVSRLEREGRLRFDREGGRPGGRLEEVRRLASARPDRSLWVAFNWDVRMGADEALDQQRSLTTFAEETGVVLQTSVLESDLDGWSGSVQRMAQVAHSGTVWLSRDGVALGRVTPAPET